MNNEMSALEGKLAAVDMQIYQLKKRKKALTEELIKVCDHKPVLGNPTKKGDSCTCCGKIVK